MSVLVLALFHPSSYNRGWSGELYVLDLSGLSKGYVEWRQPVTRGAAPPPLAAHTAILHGHDMVIFGGRASHNRINELNTLHIPSMSWTGAYVWLHRQGL